MSASLRTSLLITPLVLMFVWGAVHTPPYPNERDQGMGSRGGSLAALPELPRWVLTPLPNFSLYHDVTEKKAAFFSYIYSRTILVNSRILLQRQYLEALETKPELTRQDREWLAEQAERLRVKEPMASDAMFRQLRRKLDTVPPSLVLAQAANESAWGTSRFARQGNNLFGQWCFSRGCGLVPLNRAADASHEVASFRSGYHSVRAYIQNLNRHPSYQRLRQIRAQAREAGKEPTGSELAAGLVSYSERGQEYVKEIRAMIRYNNLMWYDQRYQATIGDRDDTGELIALARATEERLRPDFDPEGG